MKHELLEPVPATQTNAKLLMGRIQVMCVIVESSDEGFRVAVPGVDHYEGDPRMTLVTRSAIYPVKLVLQEAHVSGYSYRLQRLQVTTATEPKPRFHWGFVTTQACAVGLVSVILAGSFCGPMSNDLFPMLTRRGLRAETVGSWSPSIADNDRVAPGISVDNTLVAQDDRSSLIVESNSAQFTEMNCDFKPRHGSMISPASMSTFSDRQDEQDWGNIRQGNHQSVSKGVQKGKPVSLKAMLEEGQIGRVQSASHELLGWLNGSAPANERVSFRLSDSASADLQQFEIGLDGLPEEISDSAVASLRRSLVAVSHDLRNAAAVGGMSDVFVVASDDASIYFRKAHGQIELVRVLPLDLDKAGQQ